MFLVVYCSQHLGNHYISIGFILSIVEWWIGHFKKTLLLFIVFYFLSIRACHLWEIWPSHFQLGEKAPEGLVQVSVGFITPAFFFITLKMFFNSLTSWSRIATSRWELHFGLSTLINYHHRHVATNSWGWNRGNLFTVHKNVGLGIVHRAEPS